MEAEGMLAVRNVLIPVLDIAAQGIDLRLETLQACKKLRSSRGFPFRKPFCQEHGAQVVIRERLDFRTVAFEVIVGRIHG